MRDTLENSGALFVDITLKRSLFLPMRHQIAKTAAGPDYVGRQSVHLQISLVANDEPRGLIEQRQTLRHVIDGSIEALLFQRQPAPGRQMLRRQPPNDKDQNDGDYHRHHDDDNRITFHE